MLASSTNASRLLIVSVSNPKRHVGSINTDMKLYEISHIKVEPNLEGDEKLSPRALSNAIVRYERDPQFKTTLDFLTNELEVVKILVGKYLKDPEQRDEMASIPLHDWVQYIIDESQNQRIHIDDSKLYNLLLRCYDLIFNDNDVSDDDDMTVH